MRDLSVLDGHLHAFAKGSFPRSWFEARAADWSARVWPTRNKSDVIDSIEPGILDPEGRHLLGDLDSAGIRGGVLVGLDSTWNSGDSGEDVLSRQWDVLSACSDRLVGVVGIDPRREEAIDILSQARGFGFQALKLYPPHGYDPAAEWLFPMYEYCQETGMPVMIHTGLSRFPLTSRFANPILVQDVQARFPDLTIILAHSGWPAWWREAAITTSGHDKTYLDISGWQKEIRVDKQRLQEVLHYFRSSVGAHRMLFGSDHFSGPGRSRTASLTGWLTFVREVTNGWDSDDCDLLFGANLRRIFDFSGVEV